MQNIFNEVVEGLNKKGIKISRWCKDNGYYYNTVKNALYGVSRGDVSLEIRAKLARECCVNIDE